MKKFLKDKKKLIIALVLVSGVVGWFSYPTLATKYRFYKVKKAMASNPSYPVQIGVTQTSSILCSVSCNGGCCTGGKLCQTLVGPRLKDCPKTVEITGSPAGSALNMFLAPLEATTMTGADKGQAIFGGTSNMITENICLAGNNGCFGACCN